MFKLYSFEEILNELQKDFGIAVTLTRKAVLSTH